MFADLRAEVRRGAVCIACIVGSYGVINPDDMIAAEDDDNEATWLDAVTRHPLIDHSPS